jgi:hypothetical protein
MHLERHEGSVWSVWDLQCNELISRVKGLIVQKSAVILLCYINRAQVNVGRDGIQEVFECSVYVGGGDINSENWELGDVVVRDDKLIRRVYGVRILGTVGDKL